MNKDYTYLRVLFVKKIKETVTAVTFLLVYDRLVQKKNNNNTILKRNVW